MLLGIVFGVLTALMQSLSYLASAFFIRRHSSALKLLICSHVVMGACSALLLPFFWREGICALPAALWGYLGLWILMFVLGQAGFFLSQKLIESSRLASLLGLKIIVLSAIGILIFKEKLNYLQIIGILLSVVAAFAMNWSGGKRFDLKAITVLMITLVCYSITDFTETHMVFMRNHGNVFLAGTAVTLLCYFVLGVCSLPMLFKINWTLKMQRDAVPFSMLWLFSQITLLICFGIIGPVFGNVIQSSRGIFSVVFGAAACRLGFDVMENNGSKKLWLRRALAALLMIGGIACFSFGKIIVQ